MKTNLTEESHSLFNQLLDVNGALSGQELWERGVGTEWEEGGEN